MTSTLRLGMHQAMVFGHVGAKLRTFGKHFTQDRNVINLLNKLLVYSSVPSVSIATSTLNRGRNNPTKGILRHSSTIRVLTTQEKLSKSSYLSATPRSWNEPAFGDTFNDIVEGATVDLNLLGLHEVADWFKEVLYYNVPHGKKNRGKALIKSFEMIVDEKDLNPENLHLAQLLGWCVELSQAFFLIEDDIMDQSITRRGRPCWYKKDGVGLLGINDGIVLENLVYVILKKHFSNQVTYSDLVEAFHHSTWLTLSGQTLDMLSTPASTKPDLRRFTLDRYNKIILNKTAYYTIALPVKLATLLAGKKDSYIPAVEDILMKIGQYFQIQDDILDCFGDPKVTGKVGTDIEDGKCCWPVVMALERVTQEQLDVLQDNYGVQNEISANKVKDLYNSLGILQLYADYERNVYETLCQEIEKLPETCQIPKTVFTGILKTIHKRSN